MTAVHPHRPVAALLGVLPFVLGYMLLDWTSNIAPTRELNVTVWNPAPALGVLYVVQHGRRALPALFLAILLSDTFIRAATATNASLPLLTVIDALLALGYGAIGLLLRRRFPPDGMFADRTGLFAWAALVTAGSLLNGMVFVAALGSAGLLVSHDWGDTLLKFWTGDAVGICVSLPLFWWLVDAQRRRLFFATLLRAETLAYIGFAALTIWVAFIYGAQANFRLFYVLFLPVVWAASRQGFIGAVIVAATLQIGMLLVGYLMSPEGVTLFEVQIRAFLIALVAFLIGVTVDELRRTSAELRESLRLAAAGEMAAALAHELNQPLTALTAYGTACDMLLRQQPGDAQLQQTVRRMVAEAHRAAGVVARLRDFFRSGTVQMERLELDALVAAAAAPFHERAQQAQVDFAVDTVPPELVLLGDRLQLEVVLRNLLANAFDAVAALPAAQRRVRLTVAEDAQRVAIAVADSGPGPDDGIAARIFEPFVTNKSSGLGLGLAISRAIAAAHGGALTSASPTQGHFKLSLPLEPRRTRHDG